MKKPSALATSKLKKAIRETILSRMNEKKEQSKKSKPTQDELPSDEMSLDTISMEPSMGNASKQVQDNLENALEAAKNLGDEKLIDQIGNTITYFTRSQIVK